MKICDFGLARYFSRDDGSVPYSDNKITMCYRPPEILLGYRQYTSKIDIWSAGCIFLNLLKHGLYIRGDDPRTVFEGILELCGSPSSEELALFRKYPNYTTVFGDDEKTNLIYSGKVIKRKIRKIIQDCPNSLADLLDRIFQFDPKNRISAEEALRHAYFRDVDINSI